MNWLALLQLFLQLAVFIAQRVNKADVERAFGDALILAIGKRTDAAVAAHDDAIARGLPDIRSDPNNRDNRPDDV